MACATVQTSFSSSSLVSFMDDAWCFGSISNLSVVPASPSKASFSNATCALSTPTRATEMPFQNSGLQATDACSAATSSSGHGHGCHLGASVSDRSSQGGAAVERTHSVGEAEFRKIFANFDSDGDGLVSGDELRRFISVWGIDMSESDAQSLITSVDRNHDGGIDFDEFYSLYRTKFEGDMNSIEEAAEPEDGHVLTAAFKIFDKNQDGYISAEELQAILVGLGEPAGKSLKQCKRMIATVDRDGNGLCDYREFEEMMNASQL